jgi:hypothetical protein
MYSQETEFVVELKITKEELSAINKLLGFAYSPKAMGSIRPTTTVKTLIRAVTDKNLNIEYYG